MHMADALLSPAVGGAFWAGTIGTIGYASKKLKEHPDDRKIPLMGVLGAFIFASQMINFTIPGTGSSGHLGAYPCFVAYPLIYKPLAGDGRSARRILPASMASAIMGLQMGAFSVVLQTLLSGKTELPFGGFLLMMQPIHLAIGIVEGFVTAGVIRYVRAARPEILDSSASATQLAARISLRNVLVGFFILAVVTGGALSWFASTHPDGLEWSIGKVTGRGELPERERGVPAALKRLQEKTAFLPGYGFKPPANEPGAKKEGSPSWPNVDAGTSVSGLIGGVLVLAVSLGIGWAIRALRRRSAP
jgi:cobalt/nickel transport system permease protein